VPKQPGLSLVNGDQAGYGPTIKLLTTMHEVMMPEK